MFKTVVLAMLMLWVVQVPVAAAESSQNEKATCETCMEPPSFAGGWTIVPANVTTIERALVSYPEVMSPVTLVFEDTATLIDAQGTKTYRGVLKTWGLLSHATVTTQENEPQFAVLEYIEPLPHIWVFPSIYPLYRVVRVEIFISTDSTNEMRGSFSSRIEEDVGGNSPRVWKISSGTAQIYKSW